MIVNIVADLHGNYPEMEPADLLIIAGDLTARDDEKGFMKFRAWLLKFPFTRIIIIPGNHDGYVHSRIMEEFDKCWNGEWITYLCDSGTKFSYYPPITKDMPDGTLIERRDFKIWGTPWSLWFPEINPHCMAFTGSEQDLKEKYDLIPDDTDILISHSPFWLALDDIPNHDTGKPDYVGSKSLRDAVDRVKPDIFICGHIHEHGGKELLYKHQGPNTRCFNASHVNEHYKPVNKPIRIEL